MEVPDEMISDAIKKLAGYKCYMAKKVESEKATTIEEPEKQIVSPIRNERGKGYMCSGGNESIVPTLFKKDVVPRKTRSLIVAIEIVASELAKSINTYAELGHKLKGEGSSAAHTKYYDEKLEALTHFNVFEAFEKVIQAKVLTKIKKLLPTHIPNVIADYVKPRLNTFVLKVIKINQINLFTQPSTSIDDLSEMDLKLKLLHIIQDKKSNRTHFTN
ncbi:hypothetical protein Tco_0029207 [Tanacetum coccineum]